MSSLQIPMLLCAALLTAMANSARHLSDEPQSDGEVQTPASDEVEAQSPAPDTEELTPPAWSFTDQLSLAFALGSDGHFFEALQVAEKGIATETDKRNQQRLERFRDRVRELQTLRFEYLQTLVEAGARLKFTLDGKTVRAKVLGVSETFIQLEPSKSVPRELPITALSMEALAKQTRRLDPKLGSPASRGLLDVFGLQKSWQKLLGRDLPADVDPEPIINDLEQVTRLLEHGTAIRAIRAFLDGADDPLPDRIAAFELAAAGKSTLPDIDVHREHLKLVGWELYSSSFTEANIADALLASRVDVKGDVIVMQYDFANANEMLDFSWSVDSPSISGLQWGEVSRPKADWDFNVKEGALRAMGHYDIIHRVSLSSPASVEVKTALRYETPEASHGTLAMIVMTLCDDRVTDYVIGAIHGSSLGVTREGVLEIASVEDEDLYDFGATHLTGLTYANGVASVFDSDKQTLTLDGCTATAGYTQFLIRSDYSMAIRSITIEGTLNDLSRWELSQLYGYNQVERLGL